MGLNVQSVGLRYIKWIQEVNKRSNFQKERRARITSKQPPPSHNKSISGGHRSSIPAPIRHGTTCHLTGTAETSIPLPFNQHPSVFHHHSPLKATLHYKSANPDNVIPMPTISTLVIKCRNLPHQSASSIFRSTNNTHTRPINVLIRSNERYTSSLITLVEEAFIRTARSFHRSFFTRPRFCVIDTTTANMLREGRQSFKGEQSTHT